MSDFLKFARLYFAACRTILAADKDKKVLDLSQKLEEKRKKDEQEKVKQELNIFVPQEQENVIQEDELAKQREKQFLSEVEGKSGVWMHRFSDIKKDNQGFYILKSDNPAGNKMKPGDQLSDYAMNMTPYWEIESIKNDRINLIPINNNPFATGVGAGGAKITKHDVDVYTGEYERKRVDKLNKALEEGRADVDTLKYLLLGTVPVQFGPNGAQGGWYNSNDTYSNRGGRQGLKARDIMMRDAKTIQDHNIPVPLAALNGSMDVSNWDRWVDGSGSDTQYIPKDVNKYVDFAKRMTDKGTWRYDPSDLEKMRRTYDPAALDAYFDQMLQDVQLLSFEEWKVKYPYQDQNAKYVLDAYKRAQQDQEKLKNQTSQYLTENETNDIDSIVRNVFSTERRVANRNVQQLIELCKEDENYIKYLHDIINLGGAKDYLTNEHIIKFFDLVDDIDGLKLAAEKLKDPDNIRYALNYLYEHGEQDFVMDKATGIVDLQVLDSLIGRLSIEYDRNNELRRKTFGRNEKLLNFVKSNNIVSKIKDAIEESEIIGKHYAGEIASRVLRSFGPVDMWVPGDEELVKQFKEFR